MMYSEMQQEELLLEHSLVMFIEFNKLLKPQFYSREKTDTAEMLALIGSNTTNKFTNYDFPNNAFPWALPNQFKKSTVGMINPPYSQGSKQNPELYEISFIEHLLDSLNKGTRAIAIVPQSTMTGKTKDEKLIKKNILKSDFTNILKCGIIIIVSYEKQGYNI